MATAKKLPSGSWRCRVYSHTDENGKKIYKSFTCDDPSSLGKARCEKAAAEWLESKKLGLATAESMTFFKAASEYISGRTSVCSARTIEEYTAYLDRHLESFSKKPINQIRLADTQRLVNDLSVGRSPKTVRNVYGFVHSVLTANGIMLPDPKLPAPKPADLRLPTEAEIIRIMEAVRGKSLELPILLAAFGPMRRGEICALRAENISGNVVHVCENMIRKKVDGVKTWIIKVPKSPAGHRYIEYPDFVAEKWKGREGRIVEICPDTITKAFDDLLKELKIPHFRFHDLRHYSASIQHSLGIPDAYIMQRGGWSSDRVLKQIYRHAMDDKAKEMSDKANAYFNEKYDTRYDTKKKRARKSEPFPMDQTGVEPDKKNREKRPKSKIVEFPGNFGT